MAGEDVAQKLSSGCCKSCQCSKCCKSSLAIELIFALIWTAISIAFIVVGARNLNNCPEQRYIPIYMIVAGAFFFAYWIFLPLECFLPTVRKVLNILVGLFLFAWFIAGSVWVFRIYDQANRNCNQQMYLFVFSILIIQYILIGLGIVGSLIACFCCENSCFSGLFSCAESCSCLNCCKNIQCGSCLKCCMCAKCCKCLECAIEKA